jgi:diguanylate cyclase (GGDEF)-like protein
MRASSALLRRHGSGALGKLLIPRDGSSADPRLFRSYVILHLVGPLFGLPICVALLLLDQGPGPIAPLFTIGVFLFWSLPFLARIDFGRAAFLSVQLLTSLSLFGAYFYGGLNSPFSVWLIVAALLGFLYVPGAMLRCAAAMLTQGFVFLATDAIWPQPQWIGVDALGWLFLASTFAATLYLTLIAAFYGRIRTEGSNLAQIAARYDGAARHSRELIRRLEEEERSASAFMTRISHELRTALDVVVGYSELLAEDAAQDERETDAIRLSRITSASRRMLAWITDGDRLAEAVPEASPMARRASDLPDSRAAAEPNGWGMSNRSWHARRSLVILGLGLFLAGTTAASLGSSGPAAAALPLLALIMCALALRPGKRSTVSSDLDELTGLPGRAAFLATLERRLDGSPSREAALLFADLDGFKEVNDSLGHDVGDELLARVAQGFAAAAPSGILLARLGGDEFGAAAFGPEARALIGRFAAAMLDSLVQPVQTEEHHLTIGVSVGIAHGRAGQLRGKELLRRADVAMYRAKFDRRAPIQIFHSEMDEALNFRRTMRHDLGEALSGDQLDLHLQPVVDARTGELVSAEALLRWTHPLLGPISPAKLVTLAEQSGQIVAIDDWVLERALEHIKRLGTVPVAVNISPVQFRHPEFVRKIVDRLSAHAVPPELLRLEITEGVLVTHTRAAGRAIAQLREAGVKVSLDDFGTGYSSLSYLKDFGFDFLKVDRSFITALDDGRQGAELLRVIVDLGHSLSMGVIAEGVETAEQAGAVQLLGCDFIQGYFTGRPMSLDQLEAWRSLRVEAPHSFEPASASQLGWRASHLA